MKLAFLKFNLKFNSAALGIIKLQTHQEHLQLPQGWGIAHFADMVAILNFIVLNIYYGMLRGQINMYLPPEHPNNKIQKWSPHLRNGLCSAISCPAWWGICRLLHTMKTNPYLHVYPKVRGVGVYFDWCIMASEVEQRPTLVTAGKLIRPAQKSMLG